MSTSSSSISLLGLLFLLLSFLAWLLAVLTVLTKFDRIFFKGVKISSYLAVASLVEAAPALVLEGYALVLLESFLLKSLCSAVVWEWILFLLKLLSALLAAKQIAHSFWFLLFPLLDVPVKFCFLLTKWDLSDLRTWNFGLLGSTSVSLPLILEQSLVLCLHFTPP